MKRRKRNRFADSRLSHDCQNRMPVHLYVNNVEADVKIKKNRTHEMHTTLFLFGEIKIFVIIAGWIDNDDRETAHNVSLAEKSIHKSFFSLLFIICNVFLQLFSLYSC